MANLTLPSANVPVAKCPHCGAEVTLAGVWYEKLLALLKLVNQGL